MQNDLPLAGVTVVDLTTYAAAPAATRLLADWGADVIKIESPKGDSWRHYGDLAQVPAADDENPCWDIHDGNKKGLCLNLRAPEGMAILRRLLAKADVFVSNYRDVALSAMHLSWDEVHRDFPRLIWAHLKGYGPKGPEAVRPGYDIAAFWARSGLMGDFGQPGGEPMMPFHGVGDTITGSIFAGGLAAALYKQLRTGQGERVDISLYGTAIWTVSIPAVSAQQCYGNVYPHSRYENSSPVCMPYRCGDGEWLELCIMDYERYYGPLCHILGMDDWIDDERFNTLAAVQHHTQTFMERVEAAFLTKSRDEWGQLLGAADIVYDKISHFRDISEEEQAKANGYVYERTFENGNRAMLTNTPITFSEGRQPVRPGPHLGEHNEEILRECGYTEEEIQDLSRQGVVVSEDTLRHLR